MRSSFGKLKRLALHKSNDVKHDDDDDVEAAGGLAHLDSLAQASQDMKDIRNCYDGLLSAAAATANSAYEFSESLFEMGNCLLENTSLNEDGDCSRALSMLGRVQLELRKLVDSYRAHVILTITKPSESLLNELHKVEEMKLQCDEKREVYEYLLTQHRDKGRSRGGKGDSVTSQPLQAAHEEYDDVARLCVFRMESLKQGQCRSLFTQAARHHAAQLDFFRRGVESLEAVEPQIKSFAEKQHIDYQLSGLGNVELENEEANSYGSNEDGELSSDYKLKKQELDSAGIARNSVEVDDPNMRTSVVEDAVTNLGRYQGELVFRRQPGAGSHSAPLNAEKFDSSERIRDTHTGVRTFHKHVLPTPADAKSWTSKTISPGGGTNSMWHSSPLEADEKQRKSTEDNFLIRNISKTHNRSIPLPPPLVEGVAVPRSNLHNEFDNKKIKRLVFSGPLSSKTPSAKPSISSSGAIGPTRIAISQPLSAMNVSRSASPPLVSSPRISELHELPRPPGYLASKAMSSSVIGHSAPLVNRKREVSPTNRSPMRASNAGAALPLPPLTVPRSFSIPSSHQRAMSRNMVKRVESPKSKDRAETAVSPPYL